ncbi:NUDIX hydrolase [Streptomyces luteireticuli]|uniref:NUDIX hydrolase n=1 Tax=Streptomyces luteireticuli TaxID=173858 RepID=UPI0035569C3F
MRSLDTALLDDLASAAERDGVAKTVVGAVLADHDGKVLLLHPPADDYLGGLWELPSGGVDTGETLVEALRREVAEETGLTVTDISGYLGYFDYRSGSGRATRPFNFTATVTGETVTLTEHDAHLWAEPHPAEPGLQRRPDRSQHPAPPGSLTNSPPRPPRSLSPRRATGVCFRAEPGRPAGPYQ